MSAGTTVHHLPAITEGSEANWLRKDLPEHDAVRDEERRKTL
jgi:hypothetical protein